MGLNVLPGQSIPVPPRPPATALAEILRDVTSVSSEMVDILDATGRVLAQDVTAALDLPPWDNSAMDGYALDAQDAGLNRLPVAFTVAAGATPQPLPRGQAARIMTGAPLPPGATTVVMREDTDETDPSHVLLQTRPAPGDNIRRRGEDIAAGSVVLRAGQALHPADVGMLAAVGCARVRVTRRPVVAILSTGDELAEPGTPPHPARIYNSNAWMLAAQVAQAGGIPRVLGTAADTQAALEERLKEARDVDVLLTIGGVSVGDFDFVKPALEAVGAQLQFWRVAIRPGKPLAVGRMGNTRVFGLPGNPVSCFVTFEVFVRPVLRALSGHKAIHRRRVTAKAGGPYAKKPGLTHFVRVNLERTGDGGVVAHPRTQQSSGALSSISGADGLMVVEEARGNVTAGDTVQVLVLRDDWDSAWTW